MATEKKKVKIGLAVSAMLALGVSIACSPSQGQAAPAKSFLGAMIEAAKPGQVIKLPGGSLGELTLSKRNFSPAVTVHVGDATITKITLTDVTGLHIIGGRVVGAGGTGYAVTLTRAKDIVIRGMDISKADRGVVMNLSDGVTIEGNSLHDLRTDGINIALSRNVAIRGNSCSDFNPRPAVYSATGERLKDGDHPDCIQGWSRPTAPPTANVIVEGNQAYGYMQGIFFGNHVRGGVDDGGFDNILIRNNNVNISMYNGIVVGNGRNSLIRDNIVSTIPGSRNPARPDLMVKANLRIDGPGSRACGNKVTAIPNHPGSVSCGSPVPTPPAAATPTAPSPPGAATPTDSTRQPAPTPTVPARQPVAISTVPIRQPGAPTMVSNRPPAQTVALPSRVSPTRCDSTVVTRGPAPARVRIARGNSARC